MTGDRTRLGGAVERVTPPVTSKDISIGLGSLITNFGAATAVRGVRRIIEEKSALVAAERRLGEELIKLEEQKERWRNIDMIRDTVRNNVEADLMESELRKKRARVAMLEGEVNEKRAEKRLADIALLEQIEADLIRTRAYEAKSDARSAQRRYDEDGAEKRGWSRKQVTELRNEYEELEAMKREDIARYGSEEAFPEFLRAIYAKAEDSLGFRDVT